MYLTQSNFQDYSDYKQGSGFKSPSQFDKMSRSPSSRLESIMEDIEGGSEQKKYPNQWTERKNLSTFHLSLKKDEFQKYQTPVKANIKNQKYLDVSH